MSASSRHVVITGFMGAGKTTVARALARKIFCAVIDLDDLIRERTGRTPQEIIDEDGEHAFREHEGEALRATLETSEPCVIALGGGAWIIESNRALVNKHEAFTVWLDAPFELCWRRVTGANIQRPFARDREKAILLYDKRREFYAQATLRVEVSEGKDPETVAAEIVCMLSEVAIKMNENLRN